MNILRLDKHITINKDVMDAPNLCDRFSKNDLANIGGMVWQGYTRDKQSRARWERRTSAAMDLALQIQKDKSFPWPNCSNVVFPLVTIAALQFSARSYSNIIQGTDVVRYRVIGEDQSGKTTERANRISTHMSWQVLEEDTAWEEQHDRLLINLAIVGSTFIKTYYSPTQGHNVSELVMARDLVLDYYSKSVEASARKTQIVPLYRNEIYEKAVEKTFCDVRNEGWFQSNPAPAVDTSGHDTRQGIDPPQSDESTPFQTLEQHRLLDLDGDGYAEPYVVTIEATSKTVLRIVARFDREEDVERTRDEILRIRPTEYFTKYSFIPAPDGGVYDVGFGVLLGPLNESVNTGINQLLDAGTMQNSTGGFLGRGAKIRGGTVTFAPWEWKRIDSTGDDLRKSMVPFPDKAPSTTMFQLLGLLINYTDRVAGTTDSMVGENPGQNTPAETSRNTMEQGMQVYSMIFKRVWRSMKEEFKKLHALNAVYLPLQRSFGPNNAKILQEDYKSNADLVVPVADPNVTSMGMRIMQAVTIKQAAATTPGYSVPEAEKRFLRAMRIEGIESLYPGPDKVPPLPNPKAMVENMRLQGKKMDLDWKKQELIINLMNGRRKMQAEVAKLEAEAMAVSAGVEGEKAATRIKAFDTAINAMKTYSDMLTSQIEALKGDGDEGGGESKTGGVPGLAAPPGNTGLPGTPGALANGANGAMGGGAIP